MPLGPDCVGDFSCKEFFFFHAMEKIILIKLGTVLAFMEIEPFQKVSHVSTKTTKISWVW